MKRLNLSIVFILISSTLYPSPTYNNPFEDVIITALMENPDKDLYALLETLINSTTPDELHSLFTLAVYHNNLETLKPFSNTDSKPSPIINYWHRHAVPVATATSLILTALIIFVSVYVQFHLYAPPLLIIPPILPPIHAPGQAS